MSDVVNREDIQIFDDGDAWRAVNPVKMDPAGITPPVNYMNKKGKPTGITYAMGYHPVTGESKLAWVRYPKSMWTVEELQNDSEVADFFNKCNMCHVRDMLGEQNGDRAIQQVPTYDESESWRPMEVRTRSMVTREQVQEEYEPVRRLSPPDAVPKYMPFLFQLLKGIFLSDIGDVALTTAASVFIDFIAGSSADPGYRNALYQLSDSLIDGTISQADIENGIDGKYMDRLKKDLSRVAVAYEKDGNLIGAMKKGIFKPKDEIMGKLRPEQQPKKPGFGVNRTEATSRTSLRPSMLID